MNIALTTPKPRKINEQYQLEDCLEGDEVFITGTQALVRLPLEQAKRDRLAGLNTAGFVTGYRGSPLAAYDNALLSASKKLEAAGITFRPGVNEDLAATALFGTQEVEADPQRTRDGVFGIWYGKGPGVDRAGDALKHGNGFGASSHGGVLALLGDDHGCVSSSMPHQSDQAMASFLMPVLHPASVADFIPFGLFGIAASRFCGAWIGMKTISEILESSTTVRVAQHQPFRVPEDFPLPEGGLNFDPKKNFGPAMEARMLQRLKAFEAFARSNPLDVAAFGDRQPKHAVIAVGKAYFDVLDALEKLEISEEKARAIGLGVYKVGIVWPIEPTGFETFLEKAETALVVEEKRSFVETQLRSMLFGSGLDLKLLGKFDLQNRPLLSEAGELRPCQVAEAIAKAFSIEFPAEETDASLSATPAELEITKRTPFFCSGCPHNRSTQLPDGAKAFPGIGCHFMASWMPRNTAGLVQMGGEGVNWIGHSAYTSRKHMFQNLGDGTYFHSGLMAIRAAIAAGVNITYKILYNDAVAMTGGQPIDGSLRVEDIVAQLRGEGIKRIAVLSENPARFGHAFRGLSGVTLNHRDHLMPIQEEMQAIEGVTVIVYDQGCAAEKRRKRKKKTLIDPPKRVFINEAVCEGCGDCSKKANCISIVPKKTEWGVKRQIDQSSCNKDFSCADGFCPSFVTVVGEELKKTGDAERRSELAKMALVLPEPLNADAGEVLIAGVGGTGVVTVGAVLAMAAHLDGKGSSVLDFMGFAQKGGAVISHLKVTKDPQQSGAVRIDQSCATAMIACDLVVATMPEAFGTLSSEKTQVVCNADTAPTGDFATRGISDFQEKKRLNLIEGQAKRLASLQASQIAVELFGDSVYSNTLLMGFAWQKGLLPVSRLAIERAITLNNRAVKSNLEAFAIGRLLAEKPGAIAQPTAPAAAEEVPLSDFIASRAAFLADYHDAAYADAFKEFVGKVRQAEKPLGTSAFTRVVASNLSQLMAYKDEYEVARLHLDMLKTHPYDNGFAPGAKLYIHMAPPMLAFLRTPQGQPRKFAIPGAVALPALKTLRALRPLRGTIFDIFGLTHERRSERHLIAEYRQLIEDLLPSLTSDTLDDAIATANLAEMIRGYGYVKEAAIEKYRTALADLRSQPKNKSKQRAA